MTNFVFCSHGDLEFNGTISGNEFLVGTDVYHLPSIPSETTGHINVPEQCTIDANRYYIKRFRSYAFFNTSIESITFSPFVESLSHGILEYCRSLKFVDLSKTKISILSSYCFSMSNVLSEVLLPISLKEIQTHVFDRISQLKEVVIPYRVKTINASAFVDLSIESIYFCGTSVISTASINNLENVYVPFSFIGDNLFGVPVSRRSFACRHEASIIVHCSRRSISNMIPLIFIIVS